MRGFSMVSNSPNSQVAPALTTTTSFSNIDEFMGPFSSWANLKTLYGAKGDGITDDTQAIQNALNDLGKSGKPSVLYLGAGTYKITQTLNLTQARNVSIIGASPDSVNISWAGSSGGTMLNFQNSASTALERISFNGNNIAGTGLSLQWNGQGNYFPSTHHISDDVFQNMQIGISGGALGKGYQDSASEVSIERSKFINDSSAGVYLDDWNTVNWWIRDSLFQNNYNGVSCDAGGFHVYNSVFLNSKSGDIYAANNGYMGLRNNYSSGSPYFYYGDGPTSAHLISDIQNNAILNSSGTAITILNPGPASLLGNTIQNASGNTKPAVYFGANVANNITAVGNTFTVANPINIKSGTNSYLNFNNTTVSGSTINIAQPTLAATPRQSNSPVIEVTSFTGSAIQNAINQAVQQYSGQRPIVHLRSGAYAVSSTIVIPANSDVRLLGDTGNKPFNPTSTSGSSTLTGNNLAGPVLEIDGPSHAVVQNIGINSTGSTFSQGILVKGADQPSGRILMDQVITNGYANSGAGLNVQGLDYTVIDGINDQFQGAQGVNVIGGARAQSGLSTTARVSLVGGFTGPSFNVDKGGNLLVEDSWYENGVTRYPVLNLTGSGYLTLDNVKLAFTGSAAASTPNMNVNNFTGRLTINGGAFSGVSLNITGSNSATNVLVNNSLFNTQNGYSASISNSASKGQISLQGNWLNGQKYSNLGSTNSTWLNSMFSQILQGTNHPLVDRSIGVPTGATNLVLQGIGMENITNGVSITN